MKFTQSTQHLIRGNLYFYKDHRGPHIYVQEFTGSDYVEDESLIDEYYPWWGERVIAPSEDQIEYVELKPAPIEVPKPKPCSGKTVIIDGLEYTLT